MTKKSAESRAALATAIDSHRDNESYVASLRGSVSRIEDQLYAAKEAVAAATLADENAESERVRSLLAGADVAVLERPAPSAVAETERTIAACRRALALVKNELAEAETSLSYKQMRVRDAVGNVLAAEWLEQATHDVERLKDELGRAWAVLAFIRDRTQFDPRVDHALVAPPAPSPDALVLDRWKRAVDALMRDAAASLP